jgi:hypothetical protein
MTYVRVSSPDWPAPTWLSADGFHHTERRELSADEAQQVVERESGRVGAAVIEIIEDPETANDTHGIRPHDAAKVGAPIDVPGDAQTSPGPADTDGGSRHAER